MSEKTQITLITMAANVSGFGPKTTVEIPASIRK